jgi:predicted NBD/HSP70 family sugar kinase
MLVAERRDARRAVSAATVLRAILDHGPVARSTIARRTGLSPAAVTRQCADLISLGLIRDLPDLVTTNGAGRPFLPVDIDPDRLAVGGLHIALEHSTVALLDLRGRVRAQERFAHPSRDPSRVLRAAGERLRGFLAGHGAILGVGVACGGWVDPGTGVIVEHDPLGWRDVPVRDLLEPEVGLPVLLDGHSRALAVAERLFGVARHAASVVQLFVGNVVDAAIITGGAVHRGPRSAAGDVAHLPLGAPDDRCGCGRTGCFQATVSEQAVALDAVRAGVVARPSFVDLLTVARAGDQRAVALLERRARLVGRAVALLADVINPDVLVVAEAGVIHVPECLGALRDEVRVRSRAERAVVPPSIDAPDILGTAAGAVILDAVYTDPLAILPEAGRS